MKKLTLLLIAMAVLSGCAEDNVKFSSAEEVKPKQGPAGPQGEKGDKGDKGDPGVKGDKGETGAKGATGAKGDKGATGSKGDKGDKGDAGVNGKSCTVINTPSGAQLKCDDGTVADINDGNDGKDGKDGVDGKDGSDGKDGENAVALTSVKVNKNTCVQVHKNLWVENINGDVFDVYSNPNCQDNQGEYCDNVVPSYGVSGTIDEEEHPGSGTTCWADNIQIQGHRVSNTSRDFIIKIMDFNQ